MKIGPFTAIMTVLLTHLAVAQSTPPDGIVGNKGNQLVGIRLGVYHFTTDETVSPSEGLDVIGENKNGFTAELFYNYFILNQLAFELCLGSSTRSDITFQSPDIGQFFGSVNVYPIGVGVKITPLSGLVSDHYQPFFHGGGSLVVTRELYEFGRYIDLERYWDRDKSRADFGWWAGFGFESYVMSSVCVTSDFKYHSVDYSKSIGGYKDHSGYQITIGAAYILRKKAD